MVIFRENRGWHNSTKRQPTPNSAMCVGVDCSYWFCSQADGGSMRRLPSSDRGLAHEGAASPTPRTHLHRRLEGATERTTGVRCPLKGFCSHLVSLLNNFLRSTSNFISPDCRLASPFGAQAKEKLKTKKCQKPSPTQSEKPSDARVVHQQLKCANPPSD